MLAYKKGDKQKIPMQIINVTKIGISTFNLYGNNSWQLIFPLVMCWYIKKAPVKAKINTVIMFYHTRIYYTREIYFPVQRKVLYRPQGIVFIIRGVAEYNKNDPERPILHFSLHRKVNFECIVNSRVVKIFTLFENPL